MKPVTTGKVFISHATEDKPLAEALSDLIEAGIGLTHDQIFCTSLAGQGIPRERISSSTSRASWPIRLW